MADEGVNEDEKKGEAEGHRETGGGDKPGYFVEEKDGKTAEQLGQRGVLSGGPPVSGDYLGGEGIFCP